MTKCDAEQIARLSGRIKKIYSTAFIMPKSGDPSYQITEFRKTESEKFLNNVQDEWLLEAQTRLENGKTYSLDVYSAFSVTPLKCYDFLSEKEALFVGGQGLIKAWPIIKNLKPFAEKKEQSAITHIVSFGGPQPSVELLRYNLGQRSFWVMAPGVFDNEGFYLDAYLLCFKEEKN
jgi:hypothetical protein